MRIPAVFPIVILFFCCTSLCAQEFGGHPASTKWRHRLTDSVDIIFPLVVESKAANIQSVIARIPPSLPSPNPIRPLPLVLQSKTTISNGYVGVGPYRSEFQLIPLQNSFRLGSLPWSSLLALHEYRHVQQFDYFNRGIARTVYKVLGQEAGGLLNSLAIPNWFWEGDAVWQETSLSSQGRGRIPYFLNDARAVIRSGRRYSYMKWRNGSYRDLLPDHYPFGYLLIGYGKQRFGDDIWTKSTLGASRFSPVLYPFQGAFKRTSGVPFKRFAMEALDHFRSLEAGKNDSLANWANRQPHFVASSEFPTWIDKNNLVYTSQSYKSVPAFYVYHVPTKAVTRIATRRISVDNQFSYKNGKLVYAAYQADKRWSWSDYSVLVIHDINTGKETQVTRGSRYFSPDIDSSGKRIIAVSIDAATDSRLEEVDAETGAVLRRLPNPENFFITYPKYRGSDRVIAAIRNWRGEMSIGEWSLREDTFKLLFPFSNRIIGYPQVLDSTVIFSATADGRESAFILDGETILKVNVDSITTASVYQPASNSEAIALSGVSIAGNQLIIVPASQAQPQSLEAWLNEPVSSVYPIAIKEANILAPKADSSSALTSTPYVKSRHLLNFHSLRPYVSDPDYSLTLVSENVLNDFRTELSLLYNRNEGYKQVGVFGTHAALFPWIRGGVDFTFDRFQYLNGKKVVWNEWQPRIGLSIPLDLTNGYRYRSLQASLDYVYTKQIISGYYKDSLQGINFGYLNPSFSWTSRSQQAKQHIYPRWAQSLLLDFREAIHGATIRQFLGSAAFYFPGFWVNHSLVIQAAAQYRNNGTYQFSNSFPFSRGYSVINFRQMERLGINYHFPVAYPDAGIAQVVYLMRIRTNPFFDLTRTLGEAGETNLYRTAGAEIFFDTKWWNQQAVSFGIRYSRLIDRDVFGRTANQWEFILPVNLIRR